MAGKMSLRAYGVESKRQRHFQAYLNENLKMLNGETHRMRLVIGNAGRVISLVLLLSAVAIAEPPNSSDRTSEDQAASDRDHTIMRITNCRDRVSVIFPVEFGRRERVCQSDSL